MIKPTEDPQITPSTLVIGTANQSGLFNNEGKQKRIAFNLSGKILPQLDIVACQESHYDGRSRFPGEVRHGQSNWQCSILAGNNISEENIEFIDIDYRAAIIQTKAKHSQHFNDDDYVPERYHPLTPYFYNREHEQMEKYKYNHPYMKSNKYKNITQSQTDTANTNTDIKRDYFEHRVLCAKVSLPFTTFFLFAVYSPVQDSRNKRFACFLEQVLLLPKFANANYMILGDLNVKAAQSYTTSTYTAADFKLWNGYYEPIVQRHNLIDCSGFGTNSENDDESPVAVQYTHRWKSLLPKPANESENTSTSPSTLEDTTTGYSFSKIDYILTTPSINRYLSPTQTNFFENDDHATLSISISEESTTAPPATVERQRIRALTARSRGFRNTVIYTLRHIFPDSGSFNKYIVNGKELSDHPRQVEPASNFDKHFKFHKRVRKPDEPAMTMWQRIYSLENAFQKQQKRDGIRMRLDKRRIPVLDPATGTVINQSATAARSTIAGNKQSSRNEQQQQQQLSKQTNNNNNNSNNNKRNNQNHQQSESAQPSSAARATSASVRSTAPSASDPYDDSDYVLDVPHQLLLLPKPAPAEPPKDSPPEVMARYHIERWQCFHLALHAVNDYYDQLEKLAYHDVIHEISSDIDHLQRELAKSTISGSSSGISSGISSNNAQLQSLANQTDKMSRANTQRQKQLEIDRDVEFIVNGGKAIKLNSRRVFPVNRTSKQTTATVEEIHAAYVNQFKKREFSQAALDELLSAWTPPQPTDTNGGDGTEEDFTIDDFMAAFERLAKNKASGPDGICGETYIPHTDRLAIPLAKLVNSCWKAEIWPDFLKPANIILLHKKGDVADIGNFRPISLINVILKVIGSAVAERLQKKLKHVICPQQTGFMRGRRIHDAIRTPLMVLEDANREGSKANGYMLLLDMKRAFDSPNHEALRITMKHAGISDKFVRLVELMQAGATSRVIVGSYTTEDIPLERGVHQGGVESPILYNVATEALLRYLNKNLTGIRRDPSEIEPPRVKNVKSSAFADDTVAYLGCAPDITVTDRALELFNDAFGVECNLSKTHAIKAGNPEFEVPAKYNLLKPNESERLLGIYINSYGIDVKRTLDEILPKIDSKLACIGRSSLQPDDRAQWINTFILSMLWYVGKNIQLSRDIAVNLQRSIKNAIKAPKRNANYDCGSLWTPTSMGGYGVIDPETQCQALYYSMFTDAIARRHNEDSWGKHYMLLLEQMLESNNLGLADLANDRRLTIGLSKTHHRFTALSGKVINFAAQIDTMYKIGVNYCPSERTRIPAGASSMALPFPYVPNIEALVRYNGPQDKKKQAVNNTAQLIYKHFYKFRQDPAVPKRYRDFIQADSHLMTTETPAFLPRTNAATKAYFNISTPIFSYNNAINSLIDNEVLQAAVEGTPITVNEVTTYTPESTYSFTIDITDDVPQQKLHDPKFDIFSVIRHKFKEAADSQTTGSSNTANGSNTTIALDAINTSRIEKMKAAINGDGNSMETDSDNNTDVEIDNTEVIKTAGALYALQVRSRANESLCNWCTVRKVRHTLSNPVRFQSVHDKLGVSARRLQHASPKYLRKHRIITPPQRTQVSLLWLARTSTSVNKFYHKQLYQYMDKNCNICRTETTATEDTIQHFYFECPRARSTWKAVSKFLRSAHTPAKKPNESNPQEEQPTISNWNISWPDVVSCGRRFERGIPAAPTIFSKVMWQIRRAHIEANDPEQPVHVTAEGILCRAIRNIERRLKIHLYAESKTIAERLRPKRRKKEYKLYREWKDTMGKWLHFDPGIRPSLRFTFNSSTYFPSSETR